MIVLNTLLGSTACGFLKTFFCFNASIASARSLYKFLLVVLIHAREAGTEVKASCANKDKKVTVAHDIKPRTKLW